MQYSEQWAEEDDSVNDDVCTAKVMVAIANCLEEDIQMTFDTPSMNSNGRMPFLDLQLWCENEQVFSHFMRSKWYLSMLS